MRIFRSQILIWESFEGTNSETGKNALHCGNDIYELAVFKSQLSAQIIFMRNVLKKKEIGKNISPE